MFWLLRPDRPTPRECTPAMKRATGILPLAAIEQRLKIGECVAGCLEDPRDPDRVRQGRAEMIRSRALLIAAGYPDCNDCDALRSDPAFKWRSGGWLEARIRARRPPSASWKI